MSRHIFHIAQACRFCKDHADGSNWFFKPMPDGHIGGIAVTDPTLLNADEALLEALGLSKSEAATVMGRTRQSLYQADLSAGAKPYFKEADLVKLIVRARHKSPELDFKGIADYLLRTGRGQALKDAMPQDPQESVERELMVFGDMWMVVPDFGYFNTAHPQAVNLVMRLIGREGGRTRIFTASHKDKDNIEFVLNRAAPDALKTEAVSVEVASWVCAFPFLIIGDPLGSRENPLSAPKSYLFAEGRYTRSDWYGGRDVVRLFEKLLKGEQSVPTEKMTHKVRKMPVMPSRAPAISSEASLNKGVNAGIATQSNQIRRLLYARTHGVKRTVKV